MACKMFKIVKKGSEEVLNAKKYFLSLEFDLKPRLLTFCDPHERKSTKCCFLAVSFTTREATT